MPVVDSLKENCIVLLWLRGDNNGRRSDLGVLGSRGDTSLLVGGSIGVGGLLATEDGADSGKELAGGAVDDDDRSANSLGNLLEPGVGEQTNEDSHGDGKGGQHHRHSPVLAANTAGGDAEGLATDKNDGNLGADHDAVDNDEEVVAVNALKDVELVIETTVVEFVEDLHPDKSVEDHGVELKLLVLVEGVVAEDGVTSEVQDERGGQLEDGLPDDHLPHVDGDERRLLALRKTVEDLLSGGIRSQGKGGKGVHDEVDPQELDSGEDGFHGGGRNGGDESKEDGSDVDGDLELRVSR
ncbi:hypothetical protein CI238_06569 [Colletotrichum incanum]|uniref:Uncharacterized protein n=1 Tax=Colletotrichum incanum TaxID=1573173 RepID=A0A167AJI2_COLIC|nr:hypothetical protein CI238_06569 [Colletotrichum incanum]